MHLHKGVRITYKEEVQSTAPIHRQPKVRQRAGQVGPIQGRCKCGPLYSIAPSFRGIYLGAKTVK